MPRFYPFDLAFARTLLDPFQLFGEGVAIGAADDHRDDKKLAQGVLAGRTALRGGGAQPYPEATQRLELRASGQVAVAGDVNAGVELEERV